MSGSADERRCPVETETYALHPIELDGNCGFIDRCGRIVMPPQRTIERCWHLRLRSDGLLRVRTGWHSTGWIDARGRTVRLPAGISAGSFSEGLAVARHGRLFGYIDPRGRLVIPPRYPQAWDFSEGLGAVRLSGRNFRGPVGYVDRRGRLAFMVKGVVHRPGAFQGGRAFVVTDAGSGIIDRTGRWIREPSARPRLPYSTEAFSEGRAVLVDPSTASGCGYIDADGRVVIAPDPLRWACGAFSEGLAAVHHRRAWVDPDLPHESGGFLDLQGREVIPRCFEEVRRFGSGLAPARNGERWGYVDRQGRWALPMAYTDALPFQDGIARVAVDHEWRYIDTRGRTVWQPPSLPVAGSEVPFREVLRPEIPCSVGTGLQIIQTGAEWEQLRLKRARMGRLPLSATPIPVDFGTQLLVAASPPHAFCNGVEVRIRSVRDEGQRVVVHVESWTGSDHFCGKRPSLALHVVSIPRTSKAIVAAWHPKDLCSRISRRLRRSLRIDEQ